MMSLHRNIHHVVAAALGLVLAAPAAAETTDVAVEVTAGPRPATLRARLHVPAGQAPFPALVFLHGCSGLGRRQEAWADDLSAEGYVVLVLDSFGARGLTRVCGDRQKFPGHAEDAFAAVRVLQRRAEVDRARIGLIGWSHGGWTTLWALAGQGAHPNDGCARRSRSTRSARTPEAGRTPRRS